MPRQTGRRSLAIGDKPDRIFQAQKPDEILSIHLQEHGITDYAFALKNEHAQRNAASKYRETDLDFV